MKFSLKLLLWTMIVMAAAFGFSGFYFVNYVFERALDREAGQALDESSILKFAFETAALNVPCPARLPLSWRRSDASCLPAAHHIWPGH